MVVASDDDEDEGVDGDLSDAVIRVIRVIRAIMVIRVLRFIRVIGVNRVIIVIGVNRVIRVNRAISGIMGYYVIQVIEGG